MSPEEYERLKEAEKEHLRQLRKIKETARSLQRQQRVQHALIDMAGNMQRLGETHDEFTEKLAMGTALGEARLDMALEAAAQRPEAAPDADADLENLRAQALIRQMKLEMGAREAALETPAPSGTTALPEKTIGPMKPPTEASASPPATEAPLPEKTIGRMKP
jgi:hypothetical protein